MNKADEALADVRRWLCDNLGDGDAGKVCGMLSVVSRRIAEIDEENTKLREQARKLVPELCEQNAALCHENAHLRELVQELYEDQCDECDRWKYRDRLRELGIEVDKLVSENERLREVVTAWQTKQQAR